MRTCDICSTPIPFGTDRCPNCGYRYRPERGLNRVNEKQTYMSQFQPHPSPLDDLKKVTKIDFSKKKSSKGISAKKVIAPIISIIVSMGIVSSLMGAFIMLVDTVDFDSINLGIFQQPVAEYYSYPDLPIEAASEVEPYYTKMETLVDWYDPYYWGITESYYVYKGELDAAWMQAELEYDGVMVYAEFSKDTKDDPFREIYTSYCYYDTDDAKVVHDNALVALSEITEVSYEEMKDCAHDFFNQLGNQYRYYVNYEIGDAEFELRYDHDNIDYIVRMVGEYE